MTFIFDPARFADYPINQTRREIAAEIERMIDFLDSIGPDADDEESLGWGIDLFGTGEHPASGFISQAAEWCELEGDEHDGSEHGADDEPSLGWGIAVDQDDAEFSTVPRCTNLHDLEWDPAEHGIADEGGLQEQFAHAFYPMTGARIVAAQYPGVL